MADFTPNKKTAQDFNNGVKYIDGNAELGIWGDAVQAESINNVIEGFLYVQGLAVNQPDTSEADSVGVVEASIITAANGSARLKLKNLKGEQGVGIQSITTDGVDGNGGNKYLITLTDGRVFSFVAPKGNKGDTGNGIDSTVTTYATSISGTTVPSVGWQSTIPVVAKGSYLWTRTITTYTDGTSSTSYLSAYQGLDGKGSVESVNGQTGAVTITSANIGAVNKSGDTMTGSLHIEEKREQTNAVFSAKRTDTGNEIWFGIGTGGTNRGIWDVTKDKWVLYFDGNKVYVDGVVPYSQNNRPPITLNGSSTTSPAFYAPTNSGNNGNILVSNGSGAPSWVAHGNYINNTTTDVSGAVDTVEAYFRSSDGKSWYRRWASGWKECGGTLTLSSTDTGVSFPINFVTSTYTALVTHLNGTLTGNNYINSLRVHSRSTNSMKIHKAFSETNQEASWYCCGY